ncbi:MAG: YetF domain-containing protein [Vicinamibacterales bacterium]
MLSFDWRTLFIPSNSLLELFVRGTLLYFFILAAMRVLRRQGGSIGTADLIVVVLVADAAQNGMAGEYKSITEGVLLVGIIFLWDYAVDALSYRYLFVRRLVQPSPLLLVQNGRPLRRHLRSELLTMDDLQEQLREQGVDDIRKVKRCFIESDGRMSVIPYDPDERPTHPPEKRSF